MGGNALKAWGVERKEKVEFDVLVDEISTRLAQLFPKVRTTPVVAYADKTSFGDADILVASDHLPSNWIDQLKLGFSPQACLSNGHVHSFDYKNLQVDLIVIPEKSFEFSQNYFNYNDLGNLMGRVAHKMGFKYGHLGLYAPLRDGTHQYAELEISTDSRRVFEFLGYDFDRHQRGFKNLDEIFEFTISSPYVHRDIFLLDNRNHKARTRDAKRPTYTAFLQWLESHPEVNQYAWPQELDDKIRLKAEWHEKAKQHFPGYAQQATDAAERLALNRQFREKWNGTLVQEWTGLTGKPLGELMASCNRRPDFRSWVLTQTAEDLQTFAQNVAKTPQLKPTLGDKKRRIV
jgi:hypothetical protein